MNLLLTLGDLLEGVVAFLRETDRREDNIDVGTKDNEDDLGGVASVPSCRGVSSDVDFL
jgi:hypothetical protein